MTNMQAVIGEDQLNRLPEWVERRRENAEHLTDHIEEVDDIRIPTIPADRAHAFHQYTIVTDDRAAVKSRLEIADIGYGVYYPITIPDQPAYDCEVGVPVARQLADSVLSIPVHPQVDDDEIETVAQAVSTDLGVEQ
jgi:dTDP-4-amino-4,6-dideoxygalactose transaminase